jgi:hypothetical protein
MGLCFLALSLGSALHAQTFTTFDAPNAQSTNPAAINASGTVAGSFQDAKGSHGFVRQSNGTITTFDVPGSTGTGATGIDDAGLIVGFSNGPTATQGYFSHVTRGFLRSPTGTIQLFDCFQGTGGNPGASWTTPVAINNKGAVVGSCDVLIDIDYYSDSFVMKPNGSIAGINFSGQLGFTAATSINDKNQITGSYVAAIDATHGFILSPNGTLTSFDAVPNPDTSQSETRPQAINYAGTVVGNYTTEGGGQYHGFIRDASGNITSFDVENSTNTYPIAIKADGFIAGSYTDSAFTSHGFVRQIDGTITTFDAPNATNTVPTGMNASGTIVGTYTDSGGVTHGFIRNKASDACTLQAQPVNLNGQTLYQFTASISATAAATGVPTGTVTFWDGDAFWLVNLGSAPVINGQATFTANLPVEPHPQFVKAVYSGDNTFNGCTTHPLPLLE